MLRFLGQFQADFQLKSGWIEPLLVGGHAPFSPDCVRCVDAEEDVQYLCFLLPGLDPAHGVMLFLCSERAFHQSGPDSCQFLVDIVFLPLLLC